MTAARDDGGREQEMLPLRRLPCRQARAAVDVVDRGEVEACAFVLSLALCRDDAPVAVWRGRAHERLGVAAVLTHAELHGLVVVEAVVLEKVFGVAARRKRNLAVDRVVAVQCSEVDETVGVGSVQGGRRRGE